MNSKRTLTQDMGERVSTPDKSRLEGEALSGEALIIALKSFGLDSARHIVTRQGEPFARNLARLLFLMAGGDEIIDDDLADPSQVIDRGDVTIRARAMVADPASIDFDQVQAISGPEWCEVWDRVITGELPDWRAWGPVRREYRAGVEQSMNELRQRQRAERETKRLEAIGWLWSALRTDVGITKAELISRAEPAGINSAVMAGLLCHEPDRRYGDGQTYSEGENCLPFRMVCRDGLWSRLPPAEAKIRALLAGGQSFRRWDLMATLQDDFGYFIDEIDAALESLIGQGAIESMRIDAEEFDDEQGRMVDRSYDQISLAA